MGAGEKSYDDMLVLSSFVEIALWVWCLKTIHMSVALVVPLGLVVLSPFSHLCTYLSVNREGPSASVP